MFKLIFVFLFGSALGSFASVCIYRIPLNLSVSTPRRSFCPWCHHRIYWYQNIPILSFIFQHGRCAFCRSPIANRYLLVELFLPILGIAFVMFVPHLNLFEICFVACALFMSLVISLIDLDWRIIPDSLSVTWLLIIVLCSAWSPVFAARGWEDAFVQSVFGGAVAALVVWTTLTLGRLVKNRDVMGWGDVKLMACWGALLGWMDGTLVFFVAAVLATVWIAINSFRKKFCSNDFLPFGPFINAAGILMLWWKLAIEMPSH
jgi:leader peptidase (prepilin peptidase)/N-methyltransferase